MFVILTYDVNASRNKKVLKTCRKYLSPVQKSVFEGTISEAKLNMLKKEIAKCINTEEDSCSIYVLRTIKLCDKYSIGVDYNKNEMIYDESD